MIKAIPLIVLSFFLWQIPAKAEVDPRVKIVGQVALYGTAGGALLGLATLAFDGEGRNIAKGASLGLYAGLIFGAYVVVSHYQKLKGQTYEGSGYADDPESPYASDYDDDQLWRQVGVRKNDYSLKVKQHKPLKIKDVPIYFNLLKFNF